jgi:hypothetical protein
MNIDHTIKSAMLKSLREEGYAQLNYNAAFKISKDGAGTKYIKLAKILRDSNTGSIQLNRMTLNVNDVEAIQKALEE